MPEEVIQQPPRERSSLDVNRLTVVIAGSLAVLSLGVVPSPASDKLALAALLLLSVGTILALRRTLQGPRLWTATDEHETRSAWSWAVAMLTVAIAATAMAQTWFHPGTVLAGGDLSPPVGTAWLSQIFSPWLSVDGGQPGALETQLPWAVVQQVSHLMGLSDAIAQRIWYSLLFTGAALAAVVLLRILGMRPVPASVGGLVYVLSPYVVTVDLNPVYLAALAMLPAVLAIVLAAARGSIRVLTGALLLTAAAPMLGYVYSNPPLAGMVVGAVLLTPLAAALLDGRPAGARALRVLVLGLPLLVLASAYWLIPAVVQARSANPTLSKLSSWDWTEQRATLSNAFWLNTSWAWKDASYFPYASSYDSFPLSLLRFVLPAVAFASLLTGSGVREGTPRLARRLAVVGLTASVTLFLILLSTGTRMPGAVIFDPLYSLPLGWLLREPGRFLMIGALGYAVMVCASLSNLAETRIPSRRLRGIVGLQPRLAAVAVCVASVAGVVGFPMAIGSVAPDNRRLLPSVHVRVPAYWSTMGAFVNQLARPGGLLVLPPDDYYQMPYTWGYYGNDGFITQLIMRPTIVPNPNGYLRSPNQLLADVSRLSRALLARDDLTVDRLMHSLGVPFVLNRTDIDPTFPGRAIVSPAELETALEADSRFRLLRRIGPLTLFEYKGLAGDSLLTARQGYTTVNVSAPSPVDMAVLSADRLVSAPPRPGTPILDQLPPLYKWSRVGDTLTTTEPAPAGWKYRVVLPGTPEAALIAGSPVRVGAYAAQLDEGDVSVSLGLGRDLLATADFAQGTWQEPVVDCNDLLEPAARSSLHASVVDDGPGLIPALVLSAGADSACETHTLDATTTDILFTMLTRHLSGSPARFCMWQPASGRCAQVTSTITDVPGSAWQQMTAVLTLDPSVQPSSLWLYSDAPAGGGGTSVNEYADIHAWGVPADLPVISGLPESPAYRPVLTVLREAYSNDWTGPRGAEHVVVDGVWNGWLAESAVPAKSISYRPSAWIEAAARISLALAAVVAGGTAGIAFIRLTTRSRRRRHAGVQ